MAEKVTRGKDGSVSRTERNRRNGDTVTRRTPPRGSAEAQSRAAHSRDLDAASERQHTERRYPDIHRESTN